jgi:hypothetical protein
MDKDGEGEEGGLMVKKGWRRRSDGKERIIPGGVL